MPTFKKTKMINLIIVESITILILEVEINGE